MHARIAWGRVKPGHWDAYEQIYLDEVLPAERPTGLRGRILIRDTSDPDSGGTISLWDTEADLDAYEAGEPRASTLARMQEHFSGNFHIHKCQVRHLGLVD
jgi:heme-degrading monooxygenase HmoA